VKLGEEYKATSFNEPERTNTPGSGDYETYGKILFQIAADILGSDSNSEASSEEMKDQNRKKRKRCK
jgi:hypothetical protein